MKVSIVDGKEIKHAPLCEQFAKDLSNLMKKFTDQTGMGMAINVSYAPVDVPEEEKIEGGVALKVNLGIAFFDIPGEFERVTTSKARKLDS